MKINAWIVWSEKDAEGATTRLRALLPRGSVLLDLEFYNLDGVHVADFLCEVPTDAPEELIAKLKALGFGAKIGFGLDGKHIGLGSDSWPGSRFAN